YVIDYLADLPNDESELKETLSIGQTSEFDPTMLLTEIETINKKIDKENYLFRNDYIDEVELQRNVKNLVDTKKLLENQLQENNGDKINEQKRKRILDMLNTGNIREMNYEQQKKIVKSCISKILLTSEEITIEFNF
ncbi:MAG: recombinase, partial [Lactococcus lactis]|nr:recombinase [Lactococcus lactis]